MRRWVPSLGREHARQRRRPRYRIRPRGCRSEMQAALEVTARHCRKEAEQYGQCVAANPSSWQQDCHQLKLEMAKCTSSQASRSHPPLDLVDAIQSNLGLRLPRRATALASNCRGPGSVYIQVPQHRMRRHDLRSSRTRRSVPSGSGRFGKRLPPRNGLRSQTEVWGQRLRESGLPKATNPIVQKIRHDCAEPFSAFEQCLKLNQASVVNCTEHVQKFLLCADQVKLAT
ncbi:coiled-coil-helix-coiled-coil-helix domain-containing protein 5 isoform X2 [Zootoca vivipara]|uniref:coiled-coil-helix-coiled-coil-helix domain-containing protein 5 isoform X2 n=1 Tax=Zootoca vivipara TaxID=8524 RepID=UPI00293C015A|nr:coiled-coil-helix-coiled-coil-helix domain-containing protein 5 isoform X2 [Zootoca vivipara]